MHLQSSGTTHITTTDPLTKWPFNVCAKTPDLEPRGLPVLVLINSESPLLQNPVPCSAQPSSALLRQLSLFLRHSSGAISLTRPAHFFLSYPAQPPPCLFQYYTAFCCISLFLSVFYIYFTLSASLSFLFLYKFSFSLSLACALLPSSSSSLPHSLSSLSKSAFITLCSAALFCEALTLTVFRVRGQFPVAILGPLLPVRTCLIQIPGCFSLALTRSHPLPPPSSSVSLPSSLSVSPFFSPLCDF